MVIVMLKQGRCGNGKRGQTVFCREGEGMLQGYGKASCESSHLQSAFVQSYSQTAYMKDIINKVEAKPQMPNQWCLHCCCKADMGGFLTLYFLWFNFILGCVCSMSCRKIRLGA